MNTSFTTRKVVANAVGFLGTFFLLAVLIWAMYRYANPAPVEEARWMERQTNLAQLRVQSREVLHNYAWIDQSRGVVRLPAARAMELLVTEWQNPAAGRSSLLARLEKALPPLSSAPPATNAAPAPLKR
jgi:hypothetical protein